MYICVGVGVWVGGGVEHSTIDNREDQEKAWNLVEPKLQVNMSCLPAIGAGNWT